MSYTLFSTGRLISGKDRAEAIVALMKITRLSHERVAEELLSGQRYKLLTTQSREKGERARITFEQAGLEVELAAAQQQPPTPGKPAKRIPGNASEANRNPIKRVLFIGSLLILLALAGIGGFGWYMLYQPLDEKAMAVEDALADDRLVVIAHADVEKISLLQRHWLGQFDPEALPISSAERSVLDSLYSGPADFAERVRHLFLGVHAKSADRDGGVGLVLVGDFNAAAILDTLRAHYDLKDMGEGRWEITGKIGEGEIFVCPEKSGDNAGRKPKIPVLRITNDLMVIANGAEYEAHLWQRLAIGAASNRDLSGWRDYRNGQLASLMALLPSGVGEALSGTAGALAGHAARQAPSVTNVGMRVAPSLSGLKTELRLTSGDTAWNSATAGQLRAQLGELAKKGQGISPSFSKLVDRISVQDNAAFVEISVDLDRQLLADLGQVVQEGMDSIFSVQDAPAGDSAAPAEDQLMSSPYDYALGRDLQQLPPLDAANDGEGFRSGGLGADFSKIERNEEGLYQILVEGIAALPSWPDDRLNQSSPKVELSLWVDDVTDAQGRSLMRDERCLDKRVMFGANHEPSKSENAFNGKVSTNKQVRLREGVKVAEIAAIRGRIRLSAPTAVARIAVPLQQGAKAEHAGMRFFLNNHRPDGSVTYQLSGATDRLLELRALNKEGKPLQQDWSMGSGGRTTVHFLGHVASLELYVVEQQANHESKFELTNLFAPPKSEKPTPVAWFAPAEIPLKSWQAYEGLDFARLHGDPKDKEWHRWSNDKPLIGRAIKAPVAIELRHKPASWGNNPTADIYFPQLPELAGVLSALSYEIEIPAGEKSGKERFGLIEYPFIEPDGQPVAKHQIDGMPIALKEQTLEMDLEPNAKLEKIKGVIRFRLPTHTQSTKLAVDDLWQGVEVDGVRVTLGELSRGFSPGYGFTISGAIGKLVNLHGIGPDGTRIAATSVNFQESGEWTINLPLTAGMEKVELILADQQTKVDYPFNIVPQYPEQ